MIWKDKKLALLWALFFALVFVLFVLVYYFYLIAWSQKPKSEAIRGLIPITSIYGFGRTSKDLFNKPHDVCATKEGNLIVSDTRNSRLVKIAITGRLLKVFTDKYLKRPLGVDVSGDGRIFVADRFSQALIIFDGSGSVLKRIAVDSPLKPSFYGDKVYLATKGSIAVLTFQGDYLFHFGRYGRENEEFSFPNGLSVFKDRIFVSNTNNLRVECYSLRGENLWTVGDQAPENKKTERLFSLPAGIAVDEKYRVYVVDAFSNSIVVLDGMTGKVIERLGGVKGQKDGQFNQPSGIDYIEGDLFAVADKYNDRIQLVRIVLNSDTASTAKTSKSRRRLTVIIVSFLAVLTLLIVAVRGIRKSWSSNSFMD